VWGDRRWRRFGQWRRLGGATATPTGRGRTGGGPVTGSRGGEARRVRKGGVAGDAAAGSRRPGRWRKEATAVVEGRRCRLRLDVEDDA
jgi:hypothetical protein